MSKCNVHQFSVSETHLGRNCNVAYNYSLRYRGVSVARIFHEAADDCTQILNFVTPDNIQCFLSETVKSTSFSATIVFLCVDTRRMHYRSKKACSAIS